MLCIVRLIQNIFVVCPDHFILSHQISLFSSTSSTFFILNSTISNYIDIIVNKLNLTDYYKDELERLDNIRELKSVLEEANEVVKSSVAEETLEELADVYEVLKAIAELENKNIDDVVEIAKQKRAKRGGFEKRIFLEKTY